MDKFYVIDITDNLEDLNRDMLNWNMLPLDFKMSSNDSCIDRYGCTIIDLYNKIKNHILNHKEFIADKENDNIVIEYTTFSDNENDYNELLRRSEELQQSPYIVIINPNENEKSLADKYSSFLSLDDTNRKLSDYYSWDIWGYNVTNMYHIVLNNLGNETEDDDNIVFGEISNLDTCFDSAYDVLNKAVIEGDIFTIAKFKQNCASDKISKPVLEAAFDSKLRFINNDKISELVFPKVVPWFTEREMNKYCTECTINHNKSYYRQIKEAYNSNDEKMLISLGWNPTVPINEETIKEAMKRQIQEANNIGYYNIQALGKCDGISELNSIKIRELVVKPIYFMFWDNSAAVVFPDQFKLSSNINIAYKFEHNDRIFSGFKKITREDIDPKTEIKLICIFVDNEAFNILYDNIVSNNDIENIGGKQFNSIYSVLLNYRNQYDPDRMKIVYSYYIDILLKLICFNANLDEITDPHYIDSRLKTIFLLYKGEYSKYDQISVDNIMRIICDDDNLEKYLKFNEFELDKEIINKLKTKPCIYNTAD